MLNIRAHKLYQWLLMVFQMILTFVLWDKKNACLMFAGSC